MLELPRLQANADQLLPYFSNKSLMRDLILQINKDLNSAGIPLKLLLTKKYSYAEMCHVISDKFNEVPIQHVFNLLYRVDVSEAQLKKGMPTPGVDASLMAELIVKRELQKVVIRKLYGSTNQLSEDGSGAEEN